MGNLKQNKPEVFEKKKDLKLISWKPNEKDIEFVYNGEIEKTHTYYEFKNFCENKGMSIEEYDKRMKGEGYSCPYFFKWNFMEEFLHYHMK